MRPSDGHSPWSGMVKPGSAKDLSVPPPSAINSSWMAAEETSSVGFSSIPNKCFIEPPKHLSLIHNRNRPCWPRAAAVHQPPSCPGLHPRREGTTPGQGPRLLSPGGSGWFCRQGVQGVKMGSAGSPRLCWWLVPSHGTGGGGTLLELVVAAPWHGAGCQRPTDPGAEGPTGVLEAPLGCSGHQ